VTLLETENENKKQKIKRLKVQLEMHKEKLTKLQDENSSLKNDTYLKSMQLQEQKQDVKFL
jgi:predicted nuclease with TOPRIM domain